ncbi:uncharacterized protein TNCV_3037441 [Trichonephila clavipes]|nr:uncharacterized protein TNCV_3037441 [Trichonephila clavipes]
MPSIGGYHPYGLASILTGLESNSACVGYAWPTNCSPPIYLPELRRALLDEWCNIPQDQIDNLILSMPRRCSRAAAAMAAGYSRVPAVSARRSCEDPLGSHFENENNLESDKSQ